MRREAPGTGVTKPGRLPSFLPDPFTSVASTYIQQLLCCLPPLLLPKLLQQQLLMRLDQSQKEEPGTVSRDYCFIRTKQGY